VAFAVWLSIVCAVAIFVLFIGFAVVNVLMLLVLILAILMLPSFVRGFREGMRDDRL
jgi:hypothetical protein